jgi:hypothetical protein
LRKKGPARLTKKGGAKYCGKGEGSPNPRQRNPARGGTVPANAATNFDCAFSATGRLETAAICMSLGHIFILTRSRIVLVPRYGGALYFYPVIRRRCRLIGY